MIMCWSKILFDGMFIFENFDISGAGRRLLWREKWSRRGPGSYNRQLVRTLRTTSSQSVELLSASKICVYMATRAPTHEQHATRALVYSTPRATARVNTA